MKKLYLLVLLGCALQLGLYAQEESKPEKPEPPRSYVLPEGSTVVLIDSLGNKRNVEMPERYNGLYHPFHFVPFSDTIVIDSITYRSRIVNPADTAPKEKIGPFIHPFLKAPVILDKEDRQWRNILLEPKPAEKPTNEDDC